MTPIPYVTQGMVVALRGTVLGCVASARSRRGFDFTRSLCPANAFVRIWIPDGTGARLYSLYSRGDLHRLLAEYPTVYEVLYRDRRIFSAHPVAEDGTFEIRVPVGWWGYVVCAWAGDVEGSHTHPLGDNGSGSTDPIRVADLLRAANGVVDDIVVPVADRWRSVSTGCKEGDPETDPRTVPAGILPTEEAEEIMRLLNERGDG